MKYLSVIIQMAAIEQCFSVALFLMLYKVVLTVVVNRGHVTQHFHWFATIWIDERAGRRLMIDWRGLMKELGAAFGSP